MQEPQRLLETADLGAEARELLAAYPKSAALPREVRAAVQTQLANLPPPIMGLGVVGKAGLAVVLLAGAGTLLWGFWPRGEVPESPSSIVELRATAASEAVAEAPKTAALQASALQTFMGESAPAAEVPALLPPQALAQAPTAPRPTQNKTPVSAPKPVVAAAEKPKAPAPGGGLAEELQVLDAARAVLSQDPDKAMAGVRMHALRFPKGQLSDLRDYLEIQVHQHRKDTAAVKRLAARFFVNHPASALAGEVRSALEDQSPVAP